ncbi:hypothetical protein AKJ16_DCAP15703, partial [Drosera capensis]
MPADERSCVSSKNATKVSEEASQTKETHRNLKPEESSTKEECSSKKGQSCSGAVSSVEDEPCSSSCVSFTRWDFASKDDAHLEAEIKAALQQQRERWRKSQMRMLENMKKSVFFDDDYTSLRELESLIGDCSTRYTHSVRWHTPAHKCSSSGRCTRPIESAGAAWIVHQGRIRAETRRSFGEPPDRGTADDGKLL